MLASVVILAHKQIQKQSWVVEKGEYDKFPCSHADSLITLLVQGIFKPARDQLNVIIDFLLRCFQSLNTESLFSKKVYYTIWQTFN